MSIFDAIKRAITLPKSANSLKDLVPTIDKDLAAVPKFWYALSQKGMALAMLGDTEGLQSLFRELQEEASTTARELKTANLSDPFRPVREGARRFAADQGLEWP